METKTPLKNILSKDLNHQSSGLTPIITSSFTLRSSPSSSISTPHIHRALKVLKSTNDNNIMRQVSFTPEKEDDKMQGLVLSKSDSMSDGSPGGLKLFHKKTYKEEEENHLVLVKRKRKVLRKASKSARRLKVNVMSSKAACAEPYVPLLPCVRSSIHHDLNVLSPETVKLLLQGAFDKTLTSYTLVDCRYDYEHNGGHIEGSISLNKPALLQDMFFTSAFTSCSQRTAIIFYCEFSQKRAPKMIRHLRSIDRQMHSNCYPELYFPEIYLIDGGYSNCFKTLMNFCKPPRYVQMLEPKYEEDCKRHTIATRRAWKKTLETKHSKF